jgi:hypothetical protein
VSFCSSLSGGSAMGAAVKGSHGAQFSMPLNSYGFPSSSDNGTTSV